ncbi:hypothetical protein OTU49_002594, partial [Cherax quadricarinatus]
EEWLEGFHTPVVAHVVAAMKPDKSTPPARDRDILRARNTRTLKPATHSASLSTSSSDVTKSEPPPAPEAEFSGASTSSSGDEGRGAEMKMYLEKLRELVPYAPRSGRLSRVQLIHSAIDYITDLQESLEARARSKLRDKDEHRQPLAALPHAHDNTSTISTPLMENNANRLPTALEANTSHPAALALTSPAPAGATTRSSTTTPAPASATTRSSTTTTARAGPTTKSSTTTTAPASATNTTARAGATTRSNTTTRKPLSPTAPGPPINPS